MKSTSEKKHTRADEEEEEEEEKKKEEEEQGDPNEEEGEEEEEEQEAEDEQDDDEEVEEEAKDGGGGNILGAVKTEAAAKVITTSNNELMMTTSSLSHTRRLHNDELSWIFAFLDARDFAASLKVARHWYSVAHLKSSWPQKFSLSDHIPTFHCIRFDSSSPFLTLLSSNSSPPSRRLRVSSKQLRQNLTHNSPYSNVRHLDINASGLTRAQRKKTFGQLTNLSSLTAIELYAHECFIEAFVTALQHDAINEHIFVLKSIAFSDQLDTFSRLRVLTMHSDSVDPKAIVQLHALEYFEGDDSYSETSALVYALRYLSVYHSLRHLTLMDYRDETAAAFSQPNEDLPVAQLMTLAFGEESTERILPSTVHSICEIDNLRRLKLYIVLEWARFTDEGGDDNVSIGQFLSLESESALRNIARIESLSLDINNRVIRDDLIHDLSVVLLDWTSLRHLQLKFNCLHLVDLMQLLPSSGLPLLEELAICVEESFYLTGHETLAFLPQLQRLTLDLLETHKSEPEYLSCLLKSMKSLQHFNRLDIGLDDDAKYFSLPSELLYSVSEMVKFHSLHIYLPEMESQFDVAKWWNRVVSSSLATKLAPSVQTSPRLQQFHVFVHTAKEVTFIYRVDCTQEEVKWIDCTNERRRNSSNSNISSTSSSSFGLTQPQPHDVVDVPAPRLVGIELNPGPPRRVTVATTKSNSSPVATSSVSSKKKKKSTKSQSQKKRTRGKRNDKCEEDEEEVRLEDTDNNEEKEKKQDDQDDDDDNEVKVNINELSTRKSHATKKMKYEKTKLPSPGPTSTTAISAKAALPAMPASASISHLTSVSTNKCDSDSLSLVFSYLNSHEFSCVILVSHQWNHVSTMNTSWPPYDLQRFISQLRSNDYDNPSHRRICIGHPGRLISSSTYRKVNDIIKTNSMMLMSLIQLPHLTAINLCSSDLNQLTPFLDAMKSRLRVLILTKTGKEDRTLKPILIFPGLHLLSQLRVLVLNMIPHESEFVHLHSLEYVHFGREIRSMLMVRVLRFLAVRHQLRAVSGLQYPNALYLRKEDQVLGLLNQAIHWGDPTRFGFLHKGSLEADDPLAEFKLPHDFPVAPLSSLSLSGYAQISNQEFDALSRMPLRHLTVKLTHWVADPINWLQSPSYVRETLSRLLELELAITISSDYLSTSFGLEVLVSLKKFQLKLLCQSAVAQEMSLKVPFQAMSHLEDLKLVLYNNQPVITSDSWSPLSSLNQLRLFSLIKYKSRTEEEYATQAASLTSALSPRLVHIDSSLYVHGLYFRPTTIVANVQAEQRNWSGMTILERVKAIDRRC